MASKVKVPTGLSIKRNGARKFVCTWKLPGTNYYNNLWLQWRVLWGSGSWSDWYQGSHSIDLNRNATSYTIDISEYYSYLSPVLVDTTLQSISFRLQAWKYDVTGVETGQITSSAATFNLYSPYQPTLTAALDGTKDNWCKFTWNTPVSDTDAYPFTNCQWQSILVKESNVTDGSELSWKSTATGYQTGVVSRNSSKTIEEDTVLLAANSYTRWFRIRSRGYGGRGWSQGEARSGCSKWRYAKHVYAIPLKPRVAPTSNGSEAGNGAVVKSTAAGQIWISFAWTADSSYAHPIDRTVVEYAIGVPKTGLKPPDTPSWTTVNTTDDTGSYDKAYFQILSNQYLPLDNLVWCRVSVTHDRNTRSSDACLVKNGSLPYSSGLTPPTGLSVTNVNTETHRADIHVTHASSVPDSKIAIIFKETGKTDIVVGILNHNETDKTVQCPNWGTNTYSFAVYEFQGSTATKTVRGVTTYTVTANMKSSTVSSGGAVPMPPSNIEVKPSEVPEEALVTWSWSSFTGTKSMEISWSKNQNAWESTDQPSTYVVTDLNAARWRISGLDASVWYFKLRQIIEVNGSNTYGPYSDTYSLDLSSVTTASEADEKPAPLLSLSKSVIPKNKTGESFKASWTFVSKSGSPQTYAEICEATVTNTADVDSGTGHMTNAETTVTHGQIVARVSGDNYKTFYSTSRPILSWLTGTVHYLCVRVKTEDEDMSEWSQPVSIAVADPVVCTIADDPFVEVTEDEVTKLTLTAIPFSITITGAGESDSTALIIERASDYHIVRPDESEFDGYEGETIFSHIQNGAETITIKTDDLIGRLDDGATYRLTAIVYDNFGQMDEKSLEFEVRWSHQALVPEGVVEILDEYDVAKISPVAPTGTVQGDVCDIYRLSIDKPELVYPNAEFGEDYIDPYPAIGEFGGYRLVFRTPNDDYITANNVLAWLDLPTNFNPLDTIINFGDDSVKLRYNVDLSNSWSKEFQETHYLGGSVQGDWNSAVSRTSDISAVSVIATDQETIEAMRRLAVYSGVCHIRTRDGSSFDANIDVSESRGHEPGDLVASFSLSVTKVDTETMPGMPYDQWIETVEEE